jgi:glycerate 2-kinase
VEPRKLSQLRDEAVEIFRAAVDAVDAEKAVATHVRLDTVPDCLHLNSGQSFPISQFRRVLVVGAGKAAAPMAVSIENLIGHLLEEHSDLRTRGFSSLTIEGARD